MLCSVVLWVTNRVDAVRVMTEARFFKAECDIQYNEFIRERGREDSSYTRLDQIAREKHWDTLLTKMEADEFNLTVISPSRVFETTWAANDII